MKNLKSVLVVISLILLSSPNFITGQVPPKNFYITSRVSFDSLTENCEIKFPVFQREILRLRIMSSISEGELSLEFYNAQGEKQGNFSIGSQSLSAKKDSTKKQSIDLVRGEISKDFDNPIKGEWKIKIIPKNASGYLDITSSQYTNRKPKSKKIVINENR
jgi:hypothetical protein